MRPAGMDLLQLPSVMCSPPREGLLGHQASGEAQSIEGDSSFQPIGHQGWIYVHNANSFFIQLERPAENL